MSGNTTFLSDTALVRALAKRLADPGATLTLAEETGFGRFVGAWGLAGTDPSGFPTAPGGDVNGWNSLCRTNWFNGRFLTAEALRRQDTYVDYRSRLNAQALMPGIAHGLGLAAKGLNASSYNTDGLDLTGGFLATSDIVLRPGLAFDMIGRPILVAADFTFQLAQLIALQKSKPRRVVGGGTVFAPCICLANDPEGPAGGSPAVRPGPYLLIIEAAEKPSGEAKVYGTVCSDNQPVTCQSDAWCAGFGLSLVRFPVEVPASDDVQTAWDLRGLLSAYFFDVFEHSLIKRWDPKFGTDDGFCIGSGPGRNDAGAIALAMVYLGTDGTALWIDSWIPRRTIVDTPGEDWHRTRFGAPPRAAAWGRIHQFQCMLAESLAQDPITYQQTSASDFPSLQNRNLLRRGFRHIPPIGYLPIDPAIAQQQTAPPHANVGPAFLNNLLNLGAAQYGLVSGYVMAAELQALTYFQDTNVLAYTVVALHDDDILEDLANVFDKDPVQLDNPPTLDDRLKERFQAMAAKTSVSPALALLANLQIGFMSVGIGDLVNRRVEVVKLVVPLQGLTRPHPILGVVQEDAADQAPDWGGLPVGASTLSAFTAAGLHQPGQGLDRLPRQFVVYVKQRMVVLDLVFVTLELLQWLMQFALNLKQASNQGSSGTTVTPAANFTSTGFLRAQYQAAPAEKRALAQAALAHPSVRTALAQAIPLIQPDLAAAGRAQTFQSQIDTQDTGLRTAVPDAATRRQQAVDRVADSYAAIYPGYQFVQLLAATQPPSQAEAMVQAIGASAAGALGVAPPATVADAALKDGVPIFTSADAVTLYLQATAVNAAQPATALVRTLKTDLTVGDLLAKSPADATDLLGGTRNYQRFVAAYTAQTKTVVDHVNTAAGPAPAGAAAKLNAALARSGGDVTKALDLAAADTTNDAATKRYFDHANSVVTALGPSGAPMLTTILARRG